MTRLGVVDMPVEVRVVRGGPPLGARSGVERAEAWGVVEALVEQMTRVPGRDAADLSPGEQYTLGVRAAGRWTQGLVDRAPLSGQGPLTSADQVGTELAVAQHLAGVPGPTAVVAAGVVAWLAWVSGDVDRLVLRAL